MKKLIIITTLALTACATSGNRFTPVIDSPGPNYSQDLADCQQYSNQVMSAGEGAVSGAVAGAVFAALLGAAFHTSSRDMAWGGALSGGASAAASAESGQRGIISRCMAGRGYKVLN